MAGSTAETACGRGKVQANPTRRAVTRVRTDQGEPT
ncbi:hypothetical protein M768_06755 [Cellulosimicrobium cellulans F16]|uniref:Uncharacterized protein n=1 Tax=Cellulosimicrobium cellulans F16 TaxID=1350482 RepID=A0A0M0F8J7_CELCE|nr:hypothetical protein M768_06755 [Cellulosimicrobium cellulans F16]